MPNIKNVLYRKSKPIMHRGGIYLHNIPNSYIPLKGSYLTCIVFLGIGCKSLHLTNYYPCIPK